MAAAEALISFYFVIWKLFMNATDDTAFIVLASGHCAMAVTLIDSADCVCCHIECVCLQ